ncbi:MAG: ABC transporter substrate-binding protein [Cytophagales bacterium]|nr:ABC transporter substrate-binding protein [Cytophagales bacterium]MDW8384848.1 ABC transporter substrate-binding protein [Flammeovirgaceae bacterium]
MNIKLALDWFPNAAHTGFLAAEKLGYYDDRFLQIERIYPMSDNGKQLPAKKVIAEIAHFALTPVESLFENHDRWNSQLIALASVFQVSTSCWAIHSDVTVPKNYASLQIPYEQATVRSVFGDITFLTPGRLNTWEVFKQRQADAVWIFDIWQGIEATKSNIAIRKIYPADVQIPYLPSPLLVSSKPFLSAHQNAFHRFIEATALGFRYAAQHPKEAALMLEEECKKYHLNYSLNFLYEAQQKASLLYLNQDGEWGIMNAQEWRNYYSWLRPYLEVSSRLDIYDMFTNSFLRLPPLEWE